MSSTITSRYFITSHLPSVHDHGLVTSKGQPHQHSAIDD
jgi:hypothetical protein